MKKLTLATVVLGLGLLGTVPAQAATTPKLLRGSWLNIEDYPAQQMKTVYVSKHYVDYGRQGLDGNNNKVQSVKKIGHIKTNNAYGYKLKTTYDLPGHPHKHYYRTFYLGRETYKGHHILTFVHHKKNLFVPSSLYFKPKEFGIDY